MASEFDPAEFVDRDYQSGGTSVSSAGTGGSIPAGRAAVSRAPSREEVEARMSEAQSKLAELKRAQDDLERERTQLEELRRRQNEFQQGRTETEQQLVRGIGLLEEAEFAHRREAEQMARTLQEFREALAKVQSIRETDWTRENYNAELTRGLTIIESARMEWNGARLKFPVLAGDKAKSTGPDGKTSGEQSGLPFGARSFLELGRIGLAFTWPLVVLAFAIFLILLLRKP